MSAPAGSNHASQSEPNVGCYVYGVVPADFELESDIRGVGDPPARVTLLRQGEIAALVSDVEINRPIGTPDDLLAHERLLDAAAATAPVLPMRFGAVVRDSEAVAEDLLAAHHDEFLAALRQFEGHAQYVVKGRFVQDAILAEVLAENVEAARLRDQIRGVPEEATRNERIRLGEIINHTIAARRDAATRQLVDGVAAHCVAHNVREPTHELDAVHVAVLVPTAKLSGFQTAVDEIGRGWAGRITIRLIGAMAPYDFVQTLRPEG